MVLNIDAKFKAKGTYAFKNDMRNLANFHQSTFESLKIETLIGSFYPKKDRVISAWRVLHLATKIKIWLLIISFENTFYENAF